MEETFEETPKSVSSLTKIMEPQIMRDFPDFSWEEFKHKSENVLVTALLAVSAKDSSRLVDASDELKKQVDNIIEQNRLNRVTETYSEIEVHQTEIANYSKTNGKCVITIQSAVGYVYHKTKDEKAVAGQNMKKRQTKYNMELVYIQDEAIAGLGTAVGTTCPHCGAPIKTLGNMTCEYCGLGIIPINSKVWSLHKFYEVDYNQR